MNPFGKRRRGSELPTTGDSCFQIEVHVWGPNTFTRSKEAIPKTWLVCWQVSLLMRRYTSRSKCCSRVGKWADQSRQSIASFYCFIAKGSVGYRLWMWVCSMKLKRRTIKVPLRLKFVVWQWGKCIYELFKYLNQSAGVIRWLFQIWQWAPPAPAATT